MSTPRRDVQPPAGPGDGGGEEENVHRRLNRARTRLLMLEYQEPLSLDSLSLVEHLLGDLISTSESYERLQEREDRLSQDLAMAQVGGRQPIRVHALYGLLVQRGMEGAASPG